MRYKYGRHDTDERTITPAVSFLEDNMSATKVFVSTGTRKRKQEGAASLTTSVASISDNHNSGISIRPGHLLVALVVIVMVMVMVMVTRMVMVMYLLLYNFNYPPLSLAL